MLKSAGGRFFVVGLLALLMYIPMLLVGGVINERSHYSRNTVMNVGDEWGGRQTINGPVLVVPVTGPVTRKEVREVTDPETGAITKETFEVTEVKYKSSIYVLPTRYDATFDTVTEERKRGLFAVPVYTAELSVDFDFDLTELDDWLRDGEQIIWNRSFLQVGLTSNKALRGAADLQIDGAAFPLEPLAISGAGNSGIRSDIGDPRDMKSFRLALGFNGAETLQITPVGRVSNVQMNSDWLHPSFFGAYLPNSRDITETGFSANWSIPHLARNLPQIARENSLESAGQAGFGVRYYQPNGFYQKAYRAANYGILFIALTFLTVLLIEIRQEKKAHPVQYVLIGLAQAIFVLLMVAYAEQIGFAYAYLLASVATVGLIIFYGLIGLKLGRRTWVLGTMLVVLYALLYLILRSADYALLAGSTLAFAALGGTMIATRNEDWSGPPSDGKTRFWGRKSEAKKDAIDGK
jgi:inner membrane protein